MAKSASKITQFQV